PQPGQLITLECGQTTSGLLPAALVSVSLGDPRANGVAAWLKLAGKIVRITSSTDEVDHLSAKLRRIRGTCSWHRQHLRRETQGVHQTGSIPVRSHVPAAGCRSGRLPGKLFSSIFWKFRSSSLPAR